MSERSEDLDVMALESMLRELQPHAEMLDRDVLMYRAGRASARGWMWPATTLAATALTLILGIALWMRPAPSVMYVAVPFIRNEEVTVSPPSPSLPNDPESGAWSRYVHLQEQVVEHGLDGLPSPPREAEEAPTSLESLWNSL
jgi:hypothetical protein